jgi:hypothetical protein
MFIVDDKQAFQVVEKASFQNFVRSLNRYYKLPSRRTIVRAIDDVYNQAALDFKAIIENIPGRVAFTCDGWSLVSCAGTLSLHCIGFAMNGF